MPRWFTITEAEALLPRLEPLLREALHLRTLHAELAEDLARTSRRIESLGGAAVDLTAVLGVKARREATAERAREVLSQIDESGGQVKDLEMGLLDFPALFQGREVCLCWRLGEAGITHWHGTDEGFAGRKPIDAAFRAAIGDEPV